LDSAQSKYVLPTNFDISSGTLLASLLWGSIGTGFTVYGWKQNDMIALFGGIALVAISYFIGSPLFMSLVGAALVAGIIWLKKRL
jgi:hypothetical protein